MANVNNSEIERVTEMGKKRIISQIVGFSNYCDQNGDRVPKTDVS